MRVAAEAELRIEKSGYGQPHRYIAYKAAVSILLTITEYRDITCIRKRKTSWINVANRPIFRNVRTDRIAKVGVMGARY